MLLLLLQAIIFKRIWIPQTWNGSTLDHKSSYIFFHLQERILALWKMENSSYRKSLNKGQALKEGLPRMSAGV